MCIIATVLTTTTDDRRQTPATVTSLARGPPTLRIGCGPVISRIQIRRIRGSQPGSVPYTQVYNYWWQNWI